MSLKWNQEYTKGVFLLEIYGARICNVKMGNEINKYIFFSFSSQMVWPYNFIIIRNKIGSDCVSDY